jgi:murein DD-endopeptidase MepM/ murein hydrolase activator NlpD
VKDDDVIVIGGVAALLLLGRKGSPMGIDWGTGWVWPVPPIRFTDGQTYQPEVSNPWRSPKHYGVDVMFRRSSLTDKATAYPPGSASGSTMYFAPPGVPIVAAKDARVWSVTKAPRGWTVVLDHGKPFATFYTHLDRVDLDEHANGLSTKTKQPTLLKAGDWFGTMGGDPTEPSKLRHLHFAVWYKGSGDSASVDPLSAMASWSKPPAWPVP